MLDTKYRREDIVSTRQQHRRPPSAERQVIAAAYVAGANMLELSVRFDVYRTTVSQCLRELGVPIRRHGLSEDQVAEAVQLYGMG